MARRRKDNADAGIRAYLDRLLSVTINLVRIEEDQPTGNASGFFVQAGDKYTLLSALHSFRRHKDNADDLKFDHWFIETPIVVENQAVLLPLPQLQFVREVELVGRHVLDRGNVDFVWAHVDVEGLRTKLRAGPRLKGKRFSFNTYCGPLDHEPDKSHVYGFAAMSRTERVTGVVLRLYRYPVYELGMTFNGIDDEGFYRFKLDGAHQGDEVYFGCSGAPIADETGVIVGMVKAGSQPGNSIRGLPLARYAAA